MTTFASTRWLAIFVVLAAAAAGCGSEIGDRCATNGDCPDICRTGGGFPGGICTRECNTTTDCPAGWVCISDSSGICMLPCTTAEQCHDEIGDAWTCRSKSLQDASGDAMVCFGP